MRRLIYCYDSKGCCKINSTAVENVFCVVEGAALAAGVAVIDVICKKFLYINGARLRYIL